MPTLRQLKRWAMASLPSRAVPPLAARVALLTDEMELHLLDLLCDRARTSVDVGANIGIYTYLLSRRSKHVFAVEPHPAMAAFLRKGLSRRATVLEMALSDRSGVSEIHVPLVKGVDWDTRSSLEPNANPGLETRAVPVRLGTLDELDCRDLGFLKIDVEGHGLSVLRGGQKRLQQDRPRVLIEVEERGPGSMSEVVQTMRRLDYEGCLVSRGDLLPLSLPSVSGQPQTAGRGALDERSPTSVRNLIFLPRREWDVLMPSLRQRIRGIGPARRLASLIRA